MRLRKGFSGVAEVRIPTARGSQKCDLTQARQAAIGGLECRCQKTCSHFKIQVSILAFALMTPRIALLLIGCCSAALPVPESMAGDLQGPVLTMTEENDLFVQTDRHYSQGLRLTYMMGDNEIPEWFERGPANIDRFGMKIQATKFGFAIGQNIFTPADISIPTLIPNDRPYAGWLYAGLLYQRRGVTAKGRPALDNFELDLGVVGEESLGRYAQTKVHQIRGIGLPQGWDNQIRTEPGIALKHTRMWLFRAGKEGSSLDFIPQIGASLGNVQTHLASGFTVRLGYNAPEDFGTGTIDAPVAEQGAKKHNWGAYVFGGVDGRLVGYNVSLDGNTFRNSHNVQKNWAVADLRFGAALILKKVELSYTFVVRTKEFREQTEHDEFGSVAMKIKF